MRIDFATWRAAMDTDQWPWVFWPHERIRYMISPSSTCSLNTTRASRD